MSAGRRTSYVPAKKRYKNPKPKDTKKHSLQQTIHDLAKDLFYRNLKFVNVQSRQRKKEYYYKIKVIGFDIIKLIPYFNVKIRDKLGPYKFYFTGQINTKTSREEVLLHITVFNHEASYEPKETSVNVERCETECVTGVFGKTEVRVHT